MVRILLVVGQKNGLRKTIRGRSKCALGMSFGLRVSQRLWHCVTIPPRVRQVAAQACCEIFPGSEQLGIGYSLLSLKD